VFLVFGAAPAFGGDSYTLNRIQLALGYGNVRLPHISGPTGSGLSIGFVDAAAGNHSGLVSQQTINLNRWVAVENAFGFYRAGGTFYSEGATFFTDQVGGKLTARSSKRFVPIPFGTAGFGGSSVRNPGDILTSSSSKFGIAARLGGGFEFPFKNSLSLRVEYDRISSRFFGSWETSRHLSAGVAFGF
jgi:hypothetical protein